MNFKSFLTEARLAPLYHGTSIELANSIIHSNEIKATTMHSNYNLNIQQKNDYNAINDNMGVSLTRDMKYAKSHPISKFKSEYDLITKYDVIVFELDQQKLNNNIKIQPINYWSAEYPHAKTSKTRFTQLRPNKAWIQNEYEEFVKGKIQPLDKFITKIIIEDELSQIQKEKFRFVSEHNKLYSFKQRRYLND